MSLVGTTVGNIRFLRLLGMGGMGAVYLGYDDKLGREVAVKGIRADRLSAETRARFLREARALSQVDHPNVCRIYEYLTTDEEDFLVLERISGRGLRQVLDSGLAYPAKLALAEQIAAALEAAHAKGIIHRDLKLDNVMVTDGGTIKVLDFGLARWGEGEPAAERDAPAPASGSADIADGEEEGSPAAPVAPMAGEAEPAPAASSLDDTQLGLILGTTAAMSPEQARGERITTASDLYSLGLLFQLLFTGRPAFDSTLSADLLAVKVADGDTLAVTGIDAELAALIEEQKSPAPAARPTAAEVVRRLRELRDKPRRRLRRLAAAAALLLVAAAAAKYTYDLRRERNAALAARRQAEQARAEAEETARFVTSLFSVSNPAEARGSSITARELLDRGAAALPHELANQPRTQARLLGTVGKIYSQLGLYDRAEPLLEQALDLRQKALGPEHPDVAASLADLATLYQALGRDSEPLFRRALTIREKALGPDHPEVAATLNNLGVLYGARGEPARAQDAFERALAIRVRTLGPDSPEVAATLNNLAIVAFGQERRDEAERLLLRGLAIRRKVLPPDHPDLAANLEALGVLYDAMDRPREAEEYLRPALALWEKSLGPESPQVARLLGNLASAEAKLGRRDEAERLYLRSLELKAKRLGPDHPSLAYSLVGLGEIYRQEGRLQEAEAALRRAVEIRRAKLAPGATELRSAETSYAAILRQLGRTAEASALEKTAAAAPRASVRRMRTPDRRPPKSDR